jgi:vanillate O-demethylase ferredoxin subunit
MPEVLLVGNRLVAEGIRMLEFVDPAGRPLPAFSAGAHIDVHLADGLIRQYSLCNSPSTRSLYRLGVLLAPTSRGGSAAIHGLTEGTLVSISEPRNHFPLHTGASRSVLLAGGIGITPLLSMAEQLTENGQSFELHYFTRTRAKAAFLDRLESPALKPNVSLHVDDDVSGPFDMAGALRRICRDGVHVYVCGPAGFIAAMLDAAKDAGFAETQLHREYFAPVGTDPVESAAFSIRLARSGRSVEVGANETVVYALTRAGITVPVSCEQGVCGTCVTRVLSGVPLHRDACLTDAEHARNDQFTPCCSRATTPVLVLDL